MYYSNNMSNKNSMMPIRHPPASVISDRITTGPSSSEAPEATIYESVISDRITTGPSSSEEAPEATIYESVRSDRNTTRFSNGLEATVHKNNSKRTLDKVTLNKEIPFVLFNSRKNLGDIEKFKELPYELQDMIASYIEEGYNIKCSNYNWYHIIEDLGYLMGWDTLINLLNKYLTRRYVKVIKKCDCTIVEKFITSDDRLWIGSGYPFEIFIVDEINNYLYSDIYDPSIMYMINKLLLDTYTCREFCYDDYDDYDTDSYSEEEYNNFFDSYSEEEDDPPRSWYNGWDSD